MCGGGGGGGVQACVGGVGGGGGAGRQATYVFACLRVMRECSDIGCSRTAF